jgi:5-methylcytosine-specific restriction endonuclease McrA
MTYYEKLKDPRWQKKRLEILNRDGFKCTLCGEEQITLHVHHKVYEYGKNPWEYNNSVFTTLCETCHEMEGDFKDAYNYLVKKLLTDYDLDYFCLLRTLEERYSEILKPMEKSNP